MAEFRTTKQIDANALDLQIFRAVCEIDYFANTHRDDDARQMALAIDGMRHRIRRHMHKKDQEATGG